MLRDRRRLTAAFHCGGGGPQAFRRAHGGIGVAFFGCLRRGAGRRDGSWTQAGKDSAKNRLHYPDDTGIVQHCPFAKADEAHAGVAELADALASGASGLRPVKVQVLSPAPSNRQAPSGVPFRVSGYYGRAGRDFVSRNISAIIENEKILPIRNKFIRAFH